MSAERLTIISADTHAGANHETYRQYLESAFHDDFDAWRGQYKNPWKDLRDTDLRVRNWDDDRRDRDQLSDGVVGEVIFPNTVPPFYPGFVLFAGPPQPGDEYEHRRAGIHAHNRWLVDFCAAKPHQRAGIGQFFLNDIDDAIEDVTWIKEQGLRGGVLLPTVAPDVKWVKPLYDPEYDRLWAVLQDLELPVNLHSGTGSPNYGKYNSVPMIMISEVGFYGQRAFVHMLLSGVFERFPRLKFVMTEGSAAAIPPL
ncbi:MAG TPA: amidohydrolase family protein, partial [Ilumatobacteraceae bacterium]|nr:amidohydrolase family protein [Ilumatobacteraceae bacterium]